jgi:hypothetical protein
MPDSQLLDRFLRMQQQCAVDVAEGDNTGRVDAAGHRPGAHHTSEFAERCSSVNRVGAVEDLGRRVEATQPLIIEDQHILSVEFLGKRENS